MTFVINYEKYKNKIFNYIYYRVGMNREIAEDLTSEIFLKAFDKYESYDKSKPFQAWIYAIAHNHLVNHYRDSKNETSIDVLEESGYEIPDNNITNNMISDIDVRILLSTIISLPKLQADILMMRFMDQLSFAEIAEVIKETEGNTRVICYRAIKNIKQKFNENNE